MKIIIVGGGTAGWISLAYLAATTDCELTIIHSDEVDSIGVGESTTPTVKHVADTCGIDESSWMRDGKATFKYGIEFMDFHKKGSRWFHCFDDLLPGQSFHNPISEFGKSIFKKEISSVEYFLTKRAQNTTGFDIDWFNKSQGGCEFLLLNKLSPYNQQGYSNFNRFPGYSYHINAQQFGESLRKATPSDRYTEIRTHVEGVEYDDTGVKNIVLKDGTKMTADLYVDCTGFRKLLIGALTKFKPYEGLLNNASIWGPVKNQQIDRPSTISIAQPHGWIWETPTWGQIGSGYVFSDDFISVSQAEEHIHNHWKNKGMSWEPFKSVKFTSGSLENVAVKNVVANGLCQSFIEPLEATSIMITCVTIRNVSKIINKHNGWNNKSSKIVSTVLRRFLEETKDFVLGHYTLSDRDDTDYWRAYNNPDILEYMGKMIETKLEKEWVNHGETNLNGFNWASMLVGYDKPYLGTLPTLSDWQINNYDFYTKQLVDNYRYLYSKNISISDRLKFIHT
jgi:tryptophan halogenase